MNLQIKLDDLYSLKVRGLFPLRIKSNLGFWHSHKNYHHRNYYDKKFSIKKIIFAETFLSFELVMNTLLIAAFEKEKRTKERGGDFVGDFVRPPFLSQDIPVKPFKLGSWQVELFSQLTE